MSEVSDATQIIIVAGKGAYLLGNITLKAAMQIIKLINSAWLSKWKGKTSMGRMRAIKGDEFNYVNVETESKEELKNIEKEMKQHGILFVRMPDLCGGDGRTQYAMAMSDAPKIRALLIDHAAGAFRNIRMGLISEKDYFSTGFRADGRPTQDMWDLQHSQGEPVYGAAERRGRWQYGPPEQQMRDVQEAFQDVRVRMRDLDTRGLQSTYQWIPAEPVDVQKNFAEFSLNDHLSIFVPKEDTVLPGQGSGTNLASHGAVLFSDKSYTVVDLRNSTFHSVTGMAAMAIFRDSRLQPETERSRDRQRTPDLARDIDRTVPLGRDGSGGVLIPDAPSGRVL